MTGSALSPLTRAYYRVKPFVPRRVRWALRRKRARRVRERHRATWPINEAAGAPPEGWAGWPDGRKFALVLTHDVESQSGVNNVRPLAELELGLGFRSSFNFIPKGQYRVPEELRLWLVERGFEVGVHDLHHDGRLYSSREEFRGHAERINQYLREWGSVGFRSGFMLRNLRWLHQLDIEYDCSTFDTDPFEPQPDGVGTVFPFWISARLANGTTAARNAGSADQGALASGYAELPYTLPQDSTMFLLLREPSPRIWIEKLDWIAARGGMALVNVHPDYMAINGAAPGRQLYPSAHYEDFLRHARDTYGEDFWQPLSREVAAFVRDGVLAKPDDSRSQGIEIRHVPSKPKIWIDLDNTPHVPFFEPVVEELEARGYPVLLTARDAYQVCELAEQKGLRFQQVGRHYGRNRLLKAGGVGLRALQLRPLIRRERPRLAVSHGSRSQLVLCGLLGIPALEFADYEHSLDLPFARPRWMMGPETFAESRLARRARQFRSYPGLKEDAYAWRLEPDDGILVELGLQSSDLIVTVRPPATEAHYHRAAAENLFARFMERAHREPDVRAVVLPRNARQKAEILARWPQWFENRKAVIPDAPVDGLNLLWHSDLVVSGGGTMNREAAALGVPVYSIFRGTIGAVDRHLADQDRLVLVASEAEIDEKIALEKRDRQNATPNRSRQVLETIVDSIVEFAEESVRK